MRPAHPEHRYRLALFPLPVVLLPGALMPLHIFEQRYRDMVRDCTTSDGRFGMVYHDWDDSGPFLGEEGRIGCVAEIRQHELLADGRSLLVVGGVERFRIIDLVESDTLYFEGLVEPYPDRTVMHGEELALRRKESIRLFHTVVETLSAEPAKLPDLTPDDEISFRLAQTIQVTPGWHQRLLELQDEASRLTRLDRVFRAAMR